MCRPAKHIDWELVDELLMAQCLGTEICTHFDMHPDTFYNKVKEKYSMGFTEYSALKKTQGLNSIKQAQYRKAVKKLDNTMLIWLGKNLLNQKENPVDSFVQSEIEDKYMAMMNQLSLSQKASPESSSPNTSDSNSIIQSCSVFPSS